MGSPTERSTEHPSSSGDLRRAPRSLALLVAFLVALVFARGALIAQPGDVTPGQNPPANPAGTQDQPTKKIAVEGDWVIFNMDENQGVPFMQFVTFAQKVTSKTFYIDRTQDPRLTTPEGQPAIQILGPLRIRKEHFYSFFQTVLYIQRWVCVPRKSGESEFIDLIYLGGQRMQDVKKGIIFVPPEELERYKDQTGTYIATTLKTKHVNAQMAAANLRGPFSSGDQLSQIIGIGGPRDIMLMGMGTSVYGLYQLIKLIDVEEERPKATLRVIRLEYSSAEDIEPLLTEILSNKLRTAPQPAGGQTILPPEDQVETRVLANPNTNELIVYAHEERVREIENMVAMLDTEATSVESNYRVYRLINTLATDIEPRLRNFMQQVNTQNQRAQGAQGAPGGAGVRREPAPVIISEEKSNSLMISASKSQWGKLKTLIESLDVRQDQVLIEAALIELATQDVERFGVELGLLDLGGNDFTRPFGLTSFGLTTFEDTDGNGLPDTRLPDFENPMQGITGGILSSSDFAIPVIVNALQSNTRANVLSIPSVLVNNNEDAVVSSKEAFPTSDSNLTANTTQTSFSGFQDAGIDLAISPSISEDNYVKLDITLEVSKFTGTFDSTSSLPPPKTTRKIDTTVTMPSGHTMVFGGVIEDQASETNDGIPILKDIPILGVLFRSTEMTNRKTNLYFFLTPHILKDGDFADLQDVSFRKKLEAVRYIGNRRLKIVDPTWRGRDGVRLEDDPATIEDLDRLGGFDIPTYQRPPRGEEPQGEPESGKQGQPKGPR